MDSTSDTFEDMTNTYHTQIEQGKSSQSLRIEHLSKNLEEEGVWVPTTLREFYGLSPCNTDSREYEFDSLSEATTEKDIDQIHEYENQLKVWEVSRVMSSEFGPTSVLKSLVDDVSSLRHSNTPTDKIILCLNLLV